MAVAHHAEDASAQGSSVAAEASKKAAAFAAKAVMLSNKAAEFALSARTPKSTAPVADQP
jgi:hypothetical protein